MMVGISSHLGRVRESPFLEPRLQHSILQEDEVLAAILRGAFDHHVEGVVARAHQDGAGGGVRRERVVAVDNDILPGTHAHEGVPDTAAADEGKRCGVGRGVTHGSDDAAAARGCRDGKWGRGGSGRARDRVWGGMHVLRTYGRRNEVDGARGREIDWDIIDGLAAETSAKMEDSG